MHSSSAMANVIQEDFDITRAAFSALSKIYPPESRRLCTCIAFIHCAVSFPLLTRLDINKVNKETYGFLNTEFPDWKKALTLRDVRKNKYRSKIFKIYFTFLLYRLHLFSLFIHMWRFMSEKLGITIKW
jgi:hypothetical protein